MVDEIRLDNLKRVLVDAMVLFDDLCQEIIASKLITFGADGVNVFEGIGIGVIIQLKKDNAPFMIS